MIAGVNIQAEDCKLMVYVRARPQPGGLLRQAEQAAAEMFRDIGVEVQWRSARAKAVGNGCGIPIEVQIDADAHGAQVNPNALAYATLFGGSGTCIHVFMDRVVRGRKIDLATTVLAHVLVHELTHVIEQINRHSTDGVMKANWGVEDYRMMNFGHRLAFAPIDVELIHIGLAKRVQQPAVSE